MQDEAGLNADHRLPLGDMDLNHSMEIDDGFENEVTPLLCIAGCQWLVLIYVDSGRY